MDEYQAPLRPELATRSAYAAEAGTGMTLTPTEARLEPVAGDAAAGARVHQEDVRSCRCQSTSSPGRRQRGVVANISPYDRHLNLAQPQE
jgi:hypothetical protein